MRSKDVDRLACVGKQNILMEAYIKECEKIMAIIMIRGSGKLKEKEKTAKQDSQTRNTNKRK